MHYEQNMYNYIVRAISGGSRMVKIITDTTSGLPANFAKEYGIPVIPQVINFGEESYLEGIDIDNAAFMEKLRKSSELPKTAAPPIELFTREFERLVPLGEPIICIHPSADVSGTVRSATVAAQDFSQADIRIIDTRTIGSPLATLVELAAKLANAGENADAIESRIREMIPNSVIYFLVSTLEYLAKGGRIGGAMALLGSMLQIKPILIFHNGHVDQFEKERTHKRAINRLKELVYTQAPRDGTAHLSVMHAAVPDLGKSLADEICQEFGLDSIPILDVPPAIVTHGGPGILAIAFFKK
jgi:DegV family protein with EDD domain